ncbi:ketoacyl-ACP synthase III [Pendulispora rubella]|uniref:Ketoacyl-ACP synthase III n=1 Tax=Pendulispora rubella TaxID=2741070 RepID=A0ABZ2KTH2_9BACT
MAAKASHRVVIRGLGHYLPKQVVTNDMLIPSLASQGHAVDEAVLGRISVTSRRWSDEDETVEVMAARAVGMALEHAGMRADSIDLLVLSNWTSRRHVPELAPRIATKVGSTKALAFDVCGACTGFVLGVMTAVSYLQAGMCNRAVVVSSDQFSRGVKPGSRALMVVGDAAGAVVLERSDPSDQTTSGIIDTCLHSEGELADLITSCAPEPWIRSKVELAEYAPDRTARAAEELLQRNGLHVGDLDWMIPHPGTDAIRERVRERMGIAAERIAQNFTTCGNTGSASIPIVLSDLHHRGVIRRGNLILAPAVGAGFYHGAILLRL